MLSRRKVLSLCLLATSCGPVIAVGSKYESAVDENTFPLARPPSSFVDGSIVVGTSLGFQVRQLSREEPAVLFGRSTDESWLKGKRVEESVRVKLLDNGRAILIHAQIAGNFDTATQAAADNLIAQFHEGLTRQFSR
jgi:hypothetical protein